MAFRAVRIYEIGGGFLGFGIKADGAKKLYSANYWTVDEVDDLNSQLNTLNESIDIRSHWPDVRDPEVDRLLRDPTWEPAETHQIENEEGETVTVPSPSSAQARVRKACELVARARTEAARVG